MKRIGMPISDDTILRSLKRRATERRAETSVLVVGVDDWAWRKGSTYGTIVVDLERREVIDVLPDRSADGIADWLKQHPDIEIISRDRCGSFAQGAQEGAPQARQVADRFHILQNLREAIQAQLSHSCGSSVRPLLPADVDDECEAMISSGPRDKHGGAEHRCLSRMANIQSRQAIFDQVRALRRDGRTVSDIARQTGFHRRTIAKWIRADTLPLRNASAPKASSPRYFEDYLSRRWAQRCVRGRRLLQEIKARGYTCSFSNLERLLAKWRTPKREVARPALAAPENAARRSGDRAFDLADRCCSAVREAAWIADKRSGGEGRRKKSEWPDFAAMRRLAMRFRGMVRSKNTGNLDTWLKDVHQSGLDAMQRLARTLRRDIDAVRNAITEQWSNGQTEGQSIV